MTDKLMLEEALEDSPQTHNFLSVFEEDLSAIQSYSQEFQNYCEKIQQSQMELAAATRGLSHLVKKYSSMNFPLEKETSYMMTSFPLLSEYLDEVSSMQQILASQIADTLSFPVNRFLSADLEEVSQLQSLYKMISEEHENSVQKYMKLSKKCSERQRAEACQEVFQMRKKLHKTSLHYFSCLNLIQHKRQFVFLESLAGHLQAHISFFRLGSDYVHKQELETVHGNTKGLVLCCQKELDIQRARTSHLVASIEDSCPDAVYFPEPIYQNPTNMRSTESNPHLLAKTGFLCIRSRLNLISTKWDRAYFFTQNGNLMSQSKEEVAGGLVLDLNEPGVFAEPFDADDRRHVFQVVSPTTKKAIVLQAENECDRNEWISAITNIVIQGGYVKSSESDNKELPVDSRDSVLEVPIQFDIANLANAQESDNQMILFDENDENSELSVNGASYSQTFGVRFLGAMEVSSDRGEILVAETMRRILASRAIHNLFRTNPYLLAVSDKGLLLVDHTTHLLRALFPLEDVSFWASHKESPRLLGVISRRRAIDGSSVFSCAVYECDVTAENVCLSIRTATRLAYQAFLQRKSEEQRRHQETDILLSNINKLPDMTPQSEEAPNSSSMQQPEEATDTGVQDVDESAVLNAHRGVDSDA